MSETKRRRRLLSIGHSYVVGMNRRLVHEMAKAGGDDWEVVAAAPTFVHDELRPVRLEVDPSEPCRVVPLPAYFTRRTHAFVYGRRLRALLAEGWDMIHCWEEPYVFAGGQVAWWTPRKTPLVYFTFQSITKRYPPPFRWIESYAMRRAAGWTYSGTLVSQALQGRPGYDKPSALIPLGVDIQAFRPDADAGRAVLERLGWTPGPPVIGYLGRLVPEKGLDLLMRVLDRLAGPWRALFIGAGPMEPVLRAWAARSSDRVRVCTDVTHDKVPAYLNAMNLLCSPSQTMPNWKEQFGRMLVEAFATGVPVIGSDSGEIPFVIKDSGVVVGEKDEDGWLRAIAELLAAEPRRTQLAARGLERARDEFSWPTVARRHLDFFETLLDRRVQGSPT